MPANPTTLLLEQQYRETLLEQARRITNFVRQRFSTVDPDDIGASYAALLPLLTALITLGQRDAQALAYQFLTQVGQLETGKPSYTPPAPPAGNIAGTTSDGRPIGQALVAFIPSTFLAIRRGMPVTQAINFGRYGVERMAHTEVTDAAWRETHHQGESSDELVGWTWVTGGNKPCGACLANQNGKVHPWSKSMNRHAGCSCIESPVYRSVPNRVKRPTGMDVFTAMTAAEQASTFRTAGPIKAELVRSGRITLDDLVEVQEHHQWRPSITEKSLEALGLSDAELDEIMSSLKTKTKNPSPTS